MSLVRRRSLDGFEFEPADERINEDTVLAKTIDWESYAGAGGAGGFFLDESDVELLRDYDKAPPADQNALLEESGEKYASMFSKAIQNITLEEPVQYLLTVIHRMFQANRDRVRLFHALNSDEFNPYASFLRVLARSNYHPFTIERACFVLATLLSTAPNALENKSVYQFYSWIFAKLTDCADEFQGAALEALKVMLQRTETHRIVLQDGGVAALLRLLRSELTRNTQLVYQSGFCLWLLSFNSSMLNEFMREHVVENVVDIVLTVTREKVVRIFMSLLRNLAATGSFTEVMIHKRFLDGLSKLKLRKFSDSDIVEDINFVSDILERDQHVFSSFDVFLQELKSGKLTWGPVHTENFWKENVHKCDDDSFAVVKMLVDLLDNADPETISVACFDLGEFARLYPGGKKVVQTLGGKEKLMKQMSHDVKSVQQQALLCVQKLMVHNWNFIQRSAA